MTNFALATATGVTTGVQVQPFVGDNYSLIINGVVSVATLLIVEYFKNQRKKK
ncbi:MAG: hypothetical protein ACK479_12260 [Fluviicola sp.]